MKLKEAIEKLGIKTAIITAEEIALRKNICWNEGAKFVFSVIAKDIERVPGNVGGKKDTEQDAIEKWLIKYDRGFKGRASQRISNTPETIADPIIEKIIGSRSDTN